MFYGVHGIGDGRYGGLSSARFIALAERTFAYQGVMAARAAAQDDDHGAGSGRAYRPGRSGSAPEKVRRVESTPAALTTDPVLSAVIQYG